MKKQIYFLSTFLIASFLLVLTSCQKTENEIPKEVVDGLKITEFVQSENDQTNDKISFVYKIEDKEQYLKMEAETLNGILISSLSFKDENSVWEALTQIRANISDDNYKKEIHLQVARLAQTLKNEQSFARIELVEKVLDQLPETLYNELGADKYIQKTSQSMFYHLGIFKAAKRAHDMNTTDCYCNISDSYVNDESPFYCSEDRIVSAEEARLIIIDKASDKVFAGKAFIPQRTIDFLASGDQQFLSVSKVDQLLKDEFNNFWNEKLSQSEQQAILKDHERLDAEEDWPIPIDLSCLIYGATSGSDCGCCGNYNLPCLYCSLACYLHDLACEDCKPEWFCLPGCVPGEC